LLAQTFWTKRANKRGISYLSLYAQNSNPRSFFERAADSQTGELIMIIYLKIK